MKALKIIKPKKGMLKATLHKTGRLGFSNECHKLFNFDKQRFAKFGLDEKQDLYIKISDTSDDDSFKIAKCGIYYYVNIVRSLDCFSLTKGDNAIFDLIESEYGFFKMQKR